MAWIAYINRRSREEKEGLYRLLIPPELFRLLQIDPISFEDAHHRRLVHFDCAAGEETAVVEVKAYPGDRDPAYSLHISDMQDPLQLGWDFVIINDPKGPRFGIDKDPEGRDTFFGTASRNIGEEIRAMEAGLAPGQVRRGLGLTGSVIAALEEFCRMLGIRSIHLEALFYHNAIVYERHGFAYLEGLWRMQRIDELFQPGGSLYQRLDGSTPFRRPSFHASVRGRSWAIHDGILEGLEDEIIDGRWKAPRMYKMIGKHHGVTSSNIN